jgi:hypothetical protein
VLYEATVLLQDHDTAFKLFIDDRIPLYPWTIVLYWSSYITVPSAPWFARTRHDLRRLTVAAWVATVLVFPVYWIMPSAAPRTELADTSWAAHLLLWERDAYPPMAAFPSFHVLWAVIVAPLYRPRWVGPGYVAIVAVSSLTTRQHYLADVLAALAMAPLLLQPGRVAAVVAAAWRSCRAVVVRSRG